MTMRIMRTQVKEASCYGNLANCEAPGQKCCRTTYERVCQQVRRSFYDDYDGDGNDVMMMMMVTTVMMMMTTTIIIIEPPMTGPASSR